MTGVLPEPPQPDDRSGPPRPHQPYRLSPEQLLPPVRPPYPPYPPYPPLPPTGPMRRSRPRSHPPGPPRPNWSWDEYGLARTRTDVRCSVAAILLGLAAGILAVVFANLGSWQWWQVLLLVVLLGAMVVVSAVGARDRRRHQRRANVDRAWRWVPSRRYLAGQLLFPAVIVLQGATDLNSDDPTRPVPPLAWIAFGVVGGIAIVTQGLVVRARHRALLRRRGILP